MSAEPLEARLTEALQARASSVAVHADENALYDLLPELPLATATRSNSRNGRLSFLVACAAGVTLMAVLGVGALGSRPGDEMTASELAMEPSLSAQSSGPVTGRTPDFVIWIDPGAPPQAIASIEQDLANDAKIESSRYVTRDEVFAEFAEYYADQPAVLELVDPDEVPTYFEVTFLEYPGPDQGQTMDWLERLYGPLEGVFKIQFTSEEPSN